MSVDQFEEAKEANQSWKYSNERTSESWPAESWSYGCLGSSLQKIESRVLIGKGALMIIHVLSGWLASSYPIQRAFLQHISWRVSVETVINKRKSSCHFAWRNGSIAVWMFVHPTEYGGDIGLKGFLISQKLFLSTSEYHHYYQGGKWNMPEFLKSPYNSLSKVYRFIWSCRFVFLVLNLILLHITREFYSIKLICTNLYAVFSHVRKPYTANQNCVQLFHMWKYNQSTIA